MIISRSANYLWVVASDASESLGFSENTLNCWRNCGYLKADKHWKVILKNSKQTILYNVELCKEEMTQWWGRDAFVGP